MKKIGVGEVRVSIQGTINVLKALNDNRLSYGPFSREFERRFAQLHDKKFACFMNSGTSALQVGLHAMKEKYGWKDGAEVLVPALTFVASLNVIVQNGLKPVLVDVDARYGMDPSLAIDHMGRRAPVAVMPVHLFGQTASPALIQAAGELGVRVIADSCETVGVKGCADGDVSCFSTYACHPIQTGVGGFTLTDDPELAALNRSLANHGRSGIYTGIDDALGAQETIAARFHFERPGYSYRATEVEAALGCAELDVWSQNLAARRKNAVFLLDALADLPLQLLRPRESSWMMFPVLARSEAERDAIEAHLEKAQIETRRLVPLTNQPYLIARGVVESAYPMAARANHCGLYVGCHQFLTEEDLGRITTAFHDCFFA